MLRLGCAAAAVLLAGSVALELDTGFVQSHTRKQVVAEIRAHHRDVDRPIYYWGRQYFSAEFYSHGRALPLDDIADIEEPLSNGRDFSLIIPARRIDDVSPEIRRQLEPVGESDASFVLEPFPRGSDSRPHAQHPAVAHADTQP
jgi:hypothetical protein